MSFLDSIIAVEGLPDAYLGVYFDRLETFFKTFPKELDTFKWHVIRHFNGSRSRDSSAKKWVFPDHWSDQVIDRLLAIVGVDQSEVRRRYWGANAPVPIKGIVEVTKRFEQQFPHRYEMLKIWLEGMESRLASGHVHLQAVIPDLQVFERNHYLAPELQGPFFSLLLESLTAIVARLKQDVRPETVKLTTELLRDIKYVIRRAELPLDLTSASLGEEQQRSVLQVYLDDYFQEEGLSDLNPGKARIWKEELGELTWHGSVRGLMVQNHPEIRFNGPSNFVFGIKQLAELYGSFKPSLVKKTCFEVIPIIANLPDIIGESNSESPPRRQAYYYRPQKKAQAYRRVKKELLRELHTQMGVE